MAELTPSAAETAELEARNQSIAGRLFVAADAFLFLGFVFAYLYLRALDNNGMWNPPGQNPSGTMGLAVLVLVCVTAALVQVGAGRLASAGAAAFRAPAVAALAVGARRDRAGRVAGVPARASRPATRARSGASSSGSSPCTSCTCSAASTGSRRRPCSARRGASGHRAAVPALLVVPGRGARDLLRPLLPGLEGSIHASDRPGHERLLRGRLDDARDPPRIPRDRARVRVDDAPPGAVGVLGQPPEREEAARSSRPPRPTPSAGPVRVGSFSLPANAQSVRPTRRRVVASARKW